VQADLIVEQKKCKTKKKCLEKAIGQAIKRKSLRHRLITFPFLEQKKDILKKDVEKKKRGGSSVISKGDDRCSPGSMRSRRLEFRWRVEDDEKKKHRS